MTCTANATKIAKPVNAARMMYVLVLRLTAISLVTSRARLPPGLPGSSPEATTNLSRSWLNALSG